MAINKIYDIAVVGAGPAGATVVMSLQHSGLSVAVVDKALFPRAKPCGDAIPGRAVKVLESISVEAGQRFAAFGHKQLIRSCRVVAPNLSSFEIRFEGRGYTSPRKEFDHYLLKEAMTNENAAFFLEREIKAIEVNDKGVLLHLTSELPPLRARLLIGCDGANSMVARQLAKRKIHKAHHCGAVRAYFSNVKGLNPERTECYLLKNYLPGYFWIFPLPGNLCNAGYGMLPKDISKKRINLKQSLLSVIQSHPHLKERFANAEMVGDVGGFGLPLGSRKVPISGERFLLAGDAASLIDPATGEGIGNAMLSGKIAARHAIRCIENDNFSAGFLKAYDQEIGRHLGKEMKMKYLLQKLLKDRPWLIDMGVGLAAKNGLVHRMVWKLY